MMIAELPHGAFETEDELYARGQKVKQVCRDFLAAHPIKKNERVAVVCHSKLIASITADGVKGKGAAAKLNNFIWTKNAEVLPIDI